MALVAGSRKERTQGRPRVTDWILTRFLLYFNLHDYLCVYVSRMAAVGSASAPSVSVRRER